MNSAPRIRIVHAGFIAFALLIVGRAAQVQLVQGERWAARAARQQFTATPLLAPRGPIIDDTGLPLVESRDLVRLQIAPRDVRDRVALGRVLERAGVPREWVTRATDRRRRWVEIPGQYLPTDVAPALAMRGVRGHPSVERVLLGSDAARRLVGRVGADGRAIDGLELAMNGVLTGTRGTTAMLRDARGRRFESPTAPGTAAVPGHTVRLTLNNALQDIAERALADAVTAMSAQGGDVLVLDPSDGAVLAVASRRPSAATGGSPAFSEPFEPGSTLKPFIAAALLARGRARADESIATFGGTLELNGRTITDIHRADRMSLADVIRFSSNVGIVRFAERLTVREEYETLRDLGFGVPTGVTFPSEASGLLRLPSRWSLQSPASLAMGYELSVTPLQLALAYAAIANGGELLEPALVREVRGADGTVRWRHQRRVVRRIMPPAIAHEVRRMLESVVDSGTATDAAMATFAVAGKSGTARRIARGGGYTRGDYTATFVGMFPADRPRYVIVVKLDSPQGTYYGGKTAAPVARRVFEGVLAARGTSIDAAALSARASRRTPTTAARERLAPVESAGAQAELAALVPRASGSAPYIVQLGESARAVVPDHRARTVPDVHGLPLRAAVLLLHEAGFRVRLGAGPTGTTAPASGTSLRPGAVVQLFTDGAH